MTNLICTQIISFQRDMNWHLSNIIEMYWFIDTIVTTTFCHEFVRNISAKIGWKTCINFIPCSARTISSFCKTIIFFGAISIHRGGRHPVSVMVNTLFLKYISYCCSTSSLGNMPPATTHLKYSDLDNLIGFQYVICQCNINMG